jgi:hypothetical protein
LAFNPKWAGHLSYNIKFYQLLVGTYAADSQSRNIFAARFFGEKIPPRRHG